MLTNKKPNGEPLGFCAMIYNVSQLLCKCPRVV